MPNSRPTHYTSSILLSEIKQGKIKIPQFQREFVWERERSAKLIDSILKGYPLGTFIFWKTQERLRAVRNIGGLDLPTPPDGEFTYQVLDGQQRLTSLVAAMEGITLKEDFGEICVDLDTDPGSEDPIVYSRPSQMPKGHTAISFKQMITAGPLALTRAYPSEPHLEMIQRHRNQFNAYPFPAVELSDASLSIATEIFTRLNVGGRSLTGFEIMVAKTWDETRGFDLLERVKQMDGELAQVNYGNLDHQLFVQMVVAIAHKSIRTKDMLEMRRSEFIDTWPVAMQALRAAVDFCRSDLLIPVRALLPSERVLIPLAYYFHISGANPVGEAKRRLVDLFFRIGLSERYSGTTETRIAQDLRAVVEISQGKQPVYDYGVNASAESIRLNGHFRAGRSFIKTLLCVLTACGPRDFHTSGRVLLENALMKQKNSRNYHHFYPTAHLDKAGEVLPSNHIANITLISANLNKNLIRAKAPTKYLAEFSLQNSNLINDLKTHLITEAVLKSDDYSAFFNARNDALARELQGRLIPQQRDLGTAEVLPLNEADEVEEDELSLT